MKGKMPMMMLVLALGLGTLALVPAAAQARKGQPRPDRPRVMKAEPRGGRAALAPERFRGERERAPELRDRLRRRLLLARRRGAAPQRWRRFLRARYLKARVDPRRLRERIERFRAQHPEAAKKIRAWILEHRPELADRLRAWKERREEAGGKARGKRRTPEGARKKAPEGARGRPTPAAGPKAGKKNSLERRVDLLEKRLKVLEQRIKARLQPRKKA